MLRLKRFVMSVTSVAAVCTTGSVLARDIVNLKTVESGIHQVSYEALAEYGADVSGELVADMAMLNRGGPVSIQVTGSTLDDTVFGEGSVIRFLASQVDTLYSDTNVYTLVSDATKAVRMSVDTRAIPTGSAAVSYLATKKFAPQVNYSFTSPDPQDPWYAKRMVAAGSQASETVTLTLDELAVGGNRGSSKAKLNLNVWGASNLSGVGDDHHVVASFNGQPVVDEHFDGLSEKRYEVELDQVKAGGNQVTVDLPMDTGFAYDAVNINEISVSYPRKFKAQSNRLDFSSTFAKFRLDGFGESDTFVAMRQDHSGVSIIDSLTASCRAGCRLTLPGSGQLAHYYVSAVSALHSPQIEALPMAQDITSAQAVYLIISHPDFIGGAGNHRLESLATELSGEFGSAKVVDVDAIYAQFGDHLFDPSSIQRYIQYAHANLGTQYVLLVGGDIYDYRKFENEDATSFIPSLYAATGNNVTFAPVDAKYVDLDDDNVPDLPIARLPVRTSAQLATLLDKRTAYLARDYGGEVLLVADVYDVAQQYDFKSDADEIEAEYLGAWDVEKAYLDDMSVSAARNKITSEINAGKTLTAFFGHSSTNQWSFNGLLTGPDAANLQNQGKPTVVTQWGCWNAYYVSPNEDSMGHRFMMEGDKGAVSVMGASTLTNADSERRLARLVFARLANGERLGDAVTNAKQEYALDRPNDLDVLLGWTVLGLPELVVN